jgi:uncharacterized protein
MLAYYLLMYQVDYIDLLAFHGVNSPKELDWVVRPGGCWEVQLL